MAALDLPGNGRLNQQPSPLCVHDMVKHCRAEVALRHMAPPYQVLAMSLGAMVAVAWANACPQEISANVLINTSMRPFSSFYQRLRPANFAALLQLLIGVDTREHWERTILRLTGNHAPDEVGCCPGRRCIGKHRRKVCQRYDISIKPCAAVVVTPRVMLSQKFHQVAITR